MSKQKLHTENLKRNRKVFEPLKFILLPGDQLDSICRLTAYDAWNLMVLKTKVYSLDGKTAVYPTWNDLARELGRRTDNKSLEYLKKSIRKLAQEKCIRFSKTDYISISAKPWLVNNRGRRKRMGLNVIPRTLVKLANHKQQLKFTIALHMLCYHGSCSPSYNVLRLELTSNKERQRQVRNALHGLEREARTLFGDDLWVAPKFRDNGVLLFCQEDFMLHTKPTGKIRYTQRDSAHRIVTHNATQPTHDDEFSAEDCGFQAIYTLNRVESNNRVRGPEVPKPDISSSLRELWVDILGREPNF